ncbi:MAG: phosphoribosylanthranilate isomerase [Rhizomicrobium sp.]|jgi:phosphoribosylanthranilate isomerase
MSIQVKICGITSADAADAALRAGADFAGLNFHPGSPRKLTPDQAASLAARIRGRSRLVVLLADARDEDIGAAITAAMPDFIQLHGRETPERVAAVRQHFGLPVIKAIAIADAADLEQVPGFEKVADMLLFDAKAPAGATRPGGHGAAFDWQLLRGRSFARPWLLAGGITAENVGRAIRAAGAPGVDVSSGVETAPGVKSADMIREFVAAARAEQFTKEPQT